MPSISKTDTEARQLLHTTTRLLLNLQVETTFTCGVRPELHPTPDTCKALFTSAQTETAALALWCELCDRMQPLKL